MGVEVKRKKVKGRVSAHPLCRTGRVLSAANAGKISRLILKQKTILLPLLLLTLGIASVLSGIRDCIKLTYGQRAPVAVFGSMMENVDIAAISSQIEEIQYVTAYQESVVTLTLGEFHGEFTVYGLDIQYLDLRYGDFMSASMDNEMPYILLEEEVFSKLKKDNGKAMENDSLEEFIMETVTLGEWQKMARICGIIPKEDGEESNGCIYATRKGFEKLLSLDGDGSISGNVSISTIQPNNDMDRLPEEQTRHLSESMVNVNDEMVDYLILIKSGKGLEEILEQMIAFGLEVRISEELEEKIMDWNMSALSVKSQIMIGMVLILAGSITFYYQLCLWKAQHCEFMLWLRDICDSKKVCRQVLRYTWVIFVGKSCLLGAGVFLLMWFFRGS